MVHVLVTYDNRMPIVPTKDSSKECELSLKPFGYLDMDNLDDAMKEVSLMNKGDCTIYIYHLFHFDFNLFLII